MWLIGTLFCCEAVLRGSTPRTSTKLLSPQVLRLVGDFFYSLYGLMTSCFVAKQCFAVQLPAPPLHSTPRKMKFLTGIFLYLYILCKEVALLRSSASRFNSPHLHYMRIQASSESTRGLF